MDEHSFHEKEGHNDNSIQHRLSESRPKFKPVLVKKLLADESDDDTDDPPSNSDHSDEEFDDFNDGFQPLSEETTNDGKTKPSLVAKADVEVDVAVKDEAVVATASVTSTIEKVELPKTSDSNVRNKETESKSVLNAYLKDSLRITEYVVKKSEEEKLLLDKAAAAGAKRRSFKDSSDLESVTLQSQWQPKPATILDKRKSSSMKDPSDLNAKPKYSPDIKRHSNNSVVNQESHEHHRFSSSNLNKQHSSEMSDEKASMALKSDPMSSAKCSSSQSTANASMAAMDTPMKQPQGSARPNPCHSHRNIFQTPQNKMGSEFAKNSIQTPATIFSHWSQQHMAQTPMQSQISSSREAREHMQTPATSIVQSQSSRHENPRFV